MPRPANSTVQTPGTTPANPEEAGPDAGMDLAAAEAAAAAVPAGTADKLDMVQVPAALLADMQAQLKMLVAAQRATATGQQGAEPVKLPTLKEAKDAKHTVPVLTQEGWLVPESKNWVVAAKKAD